MNTQTQQDTTFSLLRNILATVLMIAGVTTAQAADLKPNTIYVTDTTSLYAVDETTGTAVRVGDAKPSISYIRDIAFDDSGKLYGLTGLMQFFKFDSTTSNMVAINEPTSYARSHDGLAFLNGKFYAAEISGLDSADPESGSFTSIGYYGLGAHESVSDLASGSDGVLYASVTFPPDYYGNNYSDYLATLDTTTGEMNLIGNTYIYHLRGLTEKDGVLYGINSDGDLYSIDKVSGFGTLVASGVVPNAYGMATSPAVIAGTSNTSADAGTGTDSGSGGGALSLPLMLLIAGMALLRRVDDRKARTN
jgi:hypothetical protein